jgi:hypothetical protein
MTAEDAEVLRAVLVQNCTRSDGKYMVLSSQPASDEPWSIPGAWEAADELNAELRRRSESGLEWASIDTCVGVRLAEEAAINATFESDSRIPAGWDNFYNQFPGSAGLVRVSLPAYASAGRAIVFVESGCGVLCASGWYIELRKEQGSWKIIRGEMALIA